MAQKIKSALSGRRQTVFGTSVLMAGIAIASLVFCPILFPQSNPESLFYSEQQESFFFGLFGFISAAWLLCWVASLNAWSQTAKLGQWLGLIFLCIDQVNLLGVWNALATTGYLFQGLWVAPAVIQVYITGAFFGFFTLPGLTKEDGNLTLTGLGTLVLLLPWLIARNEIVSGVQFLHGLFCG